MEYIVIRNKQVLVVNADAVQTESARISFWITKDGSKRLVADIPSESTIVIASDYVKLDSKAIERIGGS